MSDIRSSILVSFAALGILVGEATASAETGAVQSAPAKVVVTDDGPLLTTPAGMTLYQHGSENSASPKFAWLCQNVSLKVIPDDQQSGIGPRPTIGAQFEKSCADKFPPYLAPAGAATVGDFSIMKRPDGASQWAYRGYPLYTSSRDKVPGDRNGIGPGMFAGGGFRGGIRFAMDATELPAGLKMIQRQQGLVIAAKSNSHLIYTPRNGARLVNASVGAPAEAFQPVLAPAMATKVSGDWSVITTETGQRQYAFRGIPLYTAPDSIPDREILRGRDWSPIVVHKAPAMPPEIKQQLTLAGQSYATTTGRTLYSYSCMVGGMMGGAAPRVAPASCDEAGDPAGYMVSLCGDAKECARRWKPYLAAANARRVGNWAPVEITYPMFTDPRGVLYPSDAPKVRVWGFRGRPLFTYYEDEKPGDIWGDGTKGLWGSAFSALLIPGEAGAFGE